MELTVVILRETDKALFVSFYAKSCKYDGVWLPKSKTTIIEETQHESVKEAEIKIPFWLFKNLIPTDYGTSNANSHWMEIFTSHFNPEIG